MKIYWQYTWLCFPFFVSLQLVHRTHCDWKWNSTHRSRMRCVRNWPGINSSCSSSRTSSMDASSVTLRKQSNSQLSLFNVGQKILFKFFPLSFENLRGWFPEEFPIVEWQFSCFSFFRVAREIFPNWILIRIECHTESMSRLLSYHSYLLTLLAKFNIVSVIFFLLFIRLLKNQDTAANQVHKTPKLSIYFSDSTNMLLFANFFTVNHGQTFLKEKIHELEVIYALSAIPQNCFQRKNKIRPDLYRAGLLLPQFFA